MAPSRRAAAPEADVGARPLDEAPPSPATSRARYRAAARAERERVAATPWRRLCAALSLLWFQFGIALGPFMLDPWEVALYLAGAAALVGLVGWSAARGPLGAAARRLFAAAAAAVRPS
jgi:hypothetical protein